ncbi:hypothetical protein [Anaerocellum diazotrophicum]|uniref:DUF5659 domain-containing protein n=1 Tax=Caldicellulosiruptor diazotrophicus TaxID=2806205 RepID=A0ABM7NQP6_9FIRM|nr:hypothetical protein [Caldicellulosiruptor diazotrophicus]BCS82484.1 hypothetical protein CaldiYA01_24440 [Caldicellulosiruptor diazotrophicus]
MKLNNEVILAYAYVALYNLVYKDNIDVLTFGKKDFMDAFRSEMFYCFDVFDEDTILDVYERVYGRVNGADEE